MTKPVLLLLPGMINDARIWSAVADRLAHEATIRVTDLTSQDTIAAMAADAWAMVADVPASTPLHVAGFSMGGYVALEMLARPRRPVDGLALIATSARPESAEAAQMREKTLALAQRDFARLVDSLLSHGTAAQIRDDAPRLAGLRTIMMSVGAQVMVRQSRAVMARADHRDLLATLDIPVQVLCGREDRITPPALSEELAALLPRARLTMVNDAGHMLPYEQPDRVAQALRILLQTSNPEGDNT